MNPTFNVTLINNPTIDSGHPDVVECFNVIQSNPDSVYAAWFNRPFSNYYKKECKDIVRFCDAFRLYLINKYGGIYIDVDTRPLRPFDD